MKFDFTNNPEVDTDIFAEELNEEPEQFDTDDIFAGEESGDMFSDPDEVQVEQRLDVEAVTGIVNSFSSMLAGMLSAMTDQPVNRYMPPAQQRRNLAKAVVDAFPQVQMSPVTALIFAFVMTYAPVGVMAAQDYKQKKKLEKNIQDAESSIRDNTRDQRNGENNIPSQNS